MTPRALSDAKASVASPRRRITEAELCGWLAAAAPGDQLTYHRGFLAVDCDPVTTHLPDPQRMELLRAANRARFAAEKGLAHLLQRRNGPSDFTYLLIARTRPKKMPGSVLAMLAAKEAA